MAEYDRDPLMIPLGVEARSYIGPELMRLRAIERRAIDAHRGNASETDEYERGWLDACAEILGRR